MIQGAYICLIDDSFFAISANIARCKGNEVVFCIYGQLSGLRKDSIEMTLLSDDRQFDPLDISLMGLGVTYDSVLGHGALRCDAFSEEDLC